MKITKLFLMAYWLFTINSAFGQINFSTPDKYLPNPYILENQAGFDEVLFKKSKNRPANYKSLPQDGFVILLDSNKMFGKIELFGRCYNDLYGVVVSSSDTTKNYWSFKRAKSHILNMSSVLAYGLMDRSVNETDTLFEWNESFPVFYQGDLVVRNGVLTNAQIDTAAYNKFVGKVFGTRFEDASHDKQIENNLYERKIKFYPHSCEGSTLAPGYIVNTDGERIDGYIQLDRIDGVVVAVRLYPNFTLGHNHRTFKPQQLRAYGMKAKLVKADRLNETPSAFSWNAQMPNTNDRRTKKNPGYIIMADGSRQEGNLQLKAEGKKVTALSIKPEGGKTNTLSIVIVSSFGLLNAPKDISVNDSKDTFKWSEASTMSGKPNPAVEKTSLVGGYVNTIDGKKISGKIELKRMYGFITEIKIKPDGEKKLTFMPHQLASYGNNIKHVDEAPNVEVVYDDHTMPPAENNPYNLSQLALADNKVANETSEEYFSWIMGAGTPGKHTEKSITRRGYVILNNGSRIDGDLQIFRRNTKTTKYHLFEFRLQDGKNKQKYTQEDIKAYGADLGKGKILGPGDIIEGLVVAENPKLIIIPTSSGYKTESKAGFVQLVSGEVLVGQVSERKTLAGKVNIYLEDIKGKETNYKGTLLSHGYFDIEPFSEFPASVYTGKRQSYLKLMDNSIVYGRFWAGIPGVTDNNQEEKPGQIRVVSSLYDGGDLDPNDPCAAPPVPPEIPPLNAFFDEMRDEKLSRTTNAELLDEIFYFKIKTDDGYKKFKFDLVKSYGVTDSYMGEITKQGMVVHVDKKLDFYRGSITTTKDEKLNGWVAHIAKENSTDYYGVYFTPDQTTGVTVYTMGELADVQQNIIEIEEYDPLADDFLSAKDMNSTYDKHSNGRLVDMDGNVKTGNITLEFPPKLWYSSSVLYTDANGVQEIFDKDNPLQYVTFTDEGKEHKFILYNGVFVEVLYDLKPYYYFRNPFPTVQTNASRLLNNMIDYAIQKGQDAVAKAVFAESGDIETAVRISEVELGEKINIAIYMEEYLVFDEITDKSFIMLKKDLGYYTNYAEYSDLKNGCLDYLLLDKKETKALGEVNDYKTGEGVATSLSFVRKCYYPEL